MNIGQNRKKGSLNLKHRLIEIIHTKVYRELKKIFFKEKRIKAQWPEQQYEMICIHVFGVPDTKGREIGT